MRTGSPATGVEVPPQVGGVHTTTVDLCHELIVALLADRAADNLTNLREQHIGTLHGGTWSDGALVADRGGISGYSVVLLHVEGLELAGIVGHDDGLLEVLLHEVTLVLGSKVVAPIAGATDQFLQKT